jgi:sensor c-di-GMP phosphodiesterase-like protein
MFDRQRRMIRASANETVRKVLHEAGYGQGWRETRMTDLEAIRAGLNRGEFFVEYIPTIDLDSGRCVGAEALSRWRQGAGAVNPFEIVDLTQDVALSGRITYWVIETVARELGDWLRANRDVHIGINVPPEILGRGGLEYAVTNAGLMDVLDRIIVEVTERGVPDAIGVDALNRARAAGVRIALDDVGVSDANLVVLSRVNVDIIKLPKTFVDCLLDEASASARLAGLRAIMRVTDIQVIAEGVESERQVEILKEAGVKMAQGWFFSPALPAGAFQAFFAAHQ